MTTLVSLLFIVMIFIDCKITNFSLHFLYNALAVVGEQCMLFTKYNTHGGPPTHSGTLYYTLIVLKTLLLSSIHIVQEQLELPLVKCK